MNFTREPIIETVITPKEGYKLIVRNSRGSGQEEYVVDAIEVVSFGHSFFYRSLERPKSFLVPISDYEVVEAKETRVVLKNASFDRSIKIGGGREASVKASKEKAASTEEQEPAAVEQKLEKKRERRRHRRRRSTAEEEKVAEEQPTEVAEEVASQSPEEPTPEPSEEAPVLRRLIPPPSQLIAEKISQEKEQEAPIEAEDVLPNPIEEEEEKTKRKRKKRADEIVDELEIPPQTEGGEAQRVAAEQVEPATTATYSVTEEKGKFSFFGKIW